MDGPRCDIVLACRAFRGTSFKQAAKNGLEIAAKRLRIRRTANDNMLSLTLRLASIEAGKGSDETQVGIVGMRRPAGRTLERGIGGLPVEHAGAGIERRAGRLRAA